MYVDVLAVRRACKQGPESGLRGPDSAFCCAFMKVAQTWDSAKKWKQKRSENATDPKTQDESQWIVSHRILSALTIPGFN